MHDFIIHEARSLWQALLSLCFSHICVLCKQDLEIHETHLCAPCKNSMAYLPEGCCERCAHPLPLTSNIILACPNCAGRRFYYKKNISLFMLDETLKNLFHHIKYYRKHWLLDLFRTPINAHVERLLGDIKIDCIIPIPLSRMRLLHRGFNQAQVIATIVGRTLHKPVATNVLKRKFGIAQANLMRNQRLTNQRGTFMIRRADLIRGKHVLIIDDIYTTGSTVNECARILKASGTRSINVFTLARTI